MKQLLAGFLLIGIVGCGGSSPPQSGSTAPTSPYDPRESPTQAVDADPNVAALEKLGHGSSGMTGASLWESNFSARPLTRRWCISTD